jgi:crotonobetainyl-CoA:carnitine CoA-transferase CaiB-like acyl-CoA transferase
MNRALDGIHVVDLSQNLAGPFCTQVLADLGADVVKIEPPDGDAARAWGPPFWEGQSTLFLAGNRGKRSVVLDLKTPPGRDALARLIARADVFVAAFRAGVAERLGFGAEHVCRTHPRLVYLSITAYGSEGPLREQPGYDPLMQAYAGIMSMTGHPGTPPARVGTSVVDLGTGTWAALAVLGALLERERTGRGAHLVASLLDTALSLASYKITGYVAGGVIPGPMGSGFGSIAPYEAFATRDGHVMIAAANDRIFQRLCEALELADAADDPRFRTNPDRVQNREVLIPLIRERTKAFDSVGLLSLLKAHAVPSSPIQDMSQVITDPQVAASDMIRTPEHPKIEGYRDLAFPVRLDGVRPSHARPPPELGQHTEEVLSELGFDSSTIDRMTTGPRLDPVSEPSGEGD